MSTQVSVEQREGMALSPVRQRFLGLGLPPIAFCLLDGLLTLVGQSDAYWSGCYAEAREACPTLSQLLATHPSVFAGGLVIWVMTFVALILLVSDTLAVISSVAVTFGHAGGAASWFLWHFQYGYQECNALFIVAAVLLGLGLRYGGVFGAFRPYSIPFLSVKQRSVIAGVLIAVSAYVFLWPRSACVNAVLSLVSSQSQRYCQILCSEKWGSGGGLEDSIGEGTSFE